jgi:hypothetical protein
MDLVRDSKMTDEIEAAVRWWVSALRSPHFDNGDALQSGLARMAASRVNVSEEALVTFGRLLAERLPAFLRAGWWDKAIAENCQSLGSAARVLVCDYGPGGLLRDCASDAGVPGLRFPFKTCMRINPGCVQVGCGYRAPFEVIYGAVQPRQDDEP